MFNMIDRDDYYSTSSIKEKKSEDIIYDSIESLANKHYPIKMVTDLDGDSYDSNLGNRLAFIEGAITILTLYLQK